MGAFWNSRLVTATLVTGRGSSNRLHVLSCYAPTYVSSRQDKDKFDSPASDTIRCDIWAISMFGWALERKTMSGGM